MTFPTDAEYVVIGGGIVGCSTAYHLARNHSADVVLLDQGRLTCGSTWHAAGLVGQLRSSAAVTELLRYSVQLYAGLEDETGLATGWKQTGCLRLATHRDRWTEYQRLATTARSFGMDMHLLSPAEAKSMWPLLETSDLVGGCWLPTDGQVNPSDVTQSLARGARQHGVRIIEQANVAGFTHKHGKVTAVQTTAGELACEKLVLCAGIWSRALAAELGVHIPIQAVKHQYIVTEKLQGLATNAPTLRDPDRRTYFKEEVGGLAMGGYEANPIAWDITTPPADFQFQLFDDDWSHFEQHLQQAVERVPSLADVGVKRMINGPESFTPDGNFILGAAPGFSNVFVGTGFNAFGIAAGGGAGWVLAQWARDGAPPSDLWSVDIRRFGHIHADRSWVRSRTLEAYGQHYAVGYPHMEYISARPALTSPLYHALKARGAVFGCKLGWERANWFASVEEEPHDHESMGRPNWFDAVGREHHAVRSRVGLIDQSSFAKFELSGRDAGAVMEKLAATRVAQKPGRVSYTQLLNQRGGIECDLTVSEIDENLFYIVTGTGFRTHDGEWIRAHIPPAAKVEFRDVTEAWCTLSLMGPDARAVLAAVCEEPVDNANFRFLDAQHVRIAGHTVRALRVSYVGELGWELHVPATGVSEVFSVLNNAGEHHGLALVGYRAIESLRLEKAYRAWGADISPSDDVFAAGLDKQLKLSSDIEFIGRQAVARLRALPRTRRLVGVSASDPNVVLLGRETILRNGEAVGYLRSAGFGYTVNRPIGYGYVSAAEGLTGKFFEEGEFALVVATDVVPAEVHLNALYDPQGTRLRS